MARALCVGVKIPHIAAMADPSSLPALVFGWRTALMLGLGVALVAVAIVLVRSPHERAAKYWLAGFMAVVIGQFVPYIIGFAGFYDRYPALTFLPVDLALLLAPLVWFHVHTLLRGTLPARWRWWLVPGAVQFLWFAGLFVGFGVDGDAKLTFLREVQTPYVSGLFDWGAVGLGLTVIFQTWRLMQRYEVFLVTARSDAMEYRLDWLRHFFVGICLIGGGWVLMELTFQFVVPFSYGRQYICLLAEGGIVLWMGLEALTRLGQRFPKMSATASPLAEPDAAKNDEDRPARDWRDEAAILLAQIEREEWFLEPRLSINDIARRQSTNETYISRMFNQGVGQSFNQTINDMRIRHAQTLIRQTPDQPLLEIAFAAGFNSKATFNRVFRARTGQTPSTWRDSDINAGPPASQNP
ncbi:MAG: helix-turn-helix transcriptional regulator [Pseudomonadota bacterium]